MLQVIAESRQDIGWVIVGGLLVGTLFTLFVIPVVYTYLSRRAFIDSDETALGPEAGQGKQGPAAPQPVPAAE